MGKRKIIIPVVIIIIILAFVYIMLNPSTVAASLVIKEGSVEVNTGSGWEAAQNNMQLRANHKVRTLEDGKANIILFESSVIRLDVNTEVSVSELLTRKEATSVSIDQDKGRTYSKLLRVSGIENYEVVTPNTVATVRGTAFSLAIKDSDTELIVVEDTVSVHTYRGTKDNIIAETEVGPNKVLVVDNDALDQLQTTDYAGGDDWISQNLLEDEQFILDVKQRILSRYGYLIPIIKAMTGITDEELDSYLDGYLRGDYSIEDAPYSEELKKYLIFN